MNGNGELELAPQPPEKSPFLEKPPKSLLLYEKWPGNNHFLCKGNIMTGPSQDISRFLLMNFGFFLSGLPNFIYMGPFLWEFVNPVLPILSVLAFGLSYLMVFLCSFTDPGIIPRKKVFEMSGKQIPHLYNKNTIYETLKNKFHTVYNDEGRNYIYVTTELVHDIYIFKYCSTCEIFRPPKASHCKYCDNCIEVFDHHCPYLWNCIGKRNYKYYFAFLVSFTIFELINLVNAGFYFNEFYFNNEEIYSSENKRNLIMEGLLWFTTFLAGILFVIMSYFLVFHLKLLWNGSTTKDYYTNLRYLPSKGFYQTRNWCSSDPTLFSPSEKIINET